ncbi:sialic acid-binding Ig-like lectin 13 [Chiloscyllium punctatum]|uniref:sialic acid-binding Ig-like lectin 13 n=1 Tax=Chiloscyllium punctatum TaxID=137246 RepID=UPI003B638320
MKYLEQTMIKGSYFLLFLLQAGLAQEWKLHSPRKVTAQKGSCAQIPCNYSYPSYLANQPRVGIWFYKTRWRQWRTAFHSQSRSYEGTQFRHRTQLSGDLKNGDCSLTINNIRWEDSGFYYFKVEFNEKEKYGFKPSTWLQVSDFTDKPAIFPVQIIAGKLVRLRCTFNTICSGTAPTLTWDTPTIVRGSVSNTITQRGVTLTYISVLSLTPSLRHQGQTLICRVSYSTVSSEQTFVLTVQYAPEGLTISSPNGMKDSSINKIQGESAMIICSVRSYPASNLMWRHLNAIITRTSSSNELRLVIPKVTSKEAGDYQCVAENEHGTMEGSVTIIVEYAPEDLTITSLDGIKDSSITITEGDSALITCSVKSFPASNLTWKHLDVIMNSSTSHNELWMEIPHVAPRDTGDYQCVAQNEHGTVEGSLSITVQCETADAPEGLTITSPNGMKDSSINKIQGESAMIICSVRSYPASNLMWRHLNAIITRTSSSNELRLVIPKVTSKEAGDYQCVAENEHGTMEGSVTIIVEYAPEDLTITSLDGIKDSSITITEGDSALITCSVKSFPASNLTWKHLDVIMNSSTSHNELWMEIPHVTPRDTGDYQCVAQNEHGTMEGSLSITVQYSRGEILHVILILGIRAGIFIVAVVLTVAGVCVSEGQTVKGS